MHAHACHMPNFKAVKVSEVEWYNMLVTCQTSSNESVCGGVLKHACHISDL